MNNNTSQKSYKGLIIGFVAFFVVCIVVAALLTHSGSNSNSSVDEESFAISAAEELVKGQLKSPSTAKFPWGNSSFSVTKNGKKYTVKGYVDAQNGFGATVRQYWTATFELEDTSGTKIKISNGNVIFD